MKRWILAGLLAMSVFTSGCAVRAQYNRGYRYRDQYRDNHRNYPRDYNRDYPLQPHR